MKRVVILDYGSGNVPSARRALARVGADVAVTADPDAVAAADGVVVPGVGAFAACMAGLERVGAPALLRKRVAAAAPVLGICVGMQVLFDHGDEHGRTAGLGLLSGAVQRLDAARLPHMGWNTVQAPAESRLFAGIGASERFYFVHSYAAVASSGAVTYAAHGSRFVAAVEAPALAATQFHPEKSGDVGAQLLANWLDQL